MTEKQYAKLYQEMGDLKAKLEAVADEAQAAANEHYDDKSEAWQNGERGEIFGEFRDELDSLYDAIQDLSIPDWPQM